MNFEEEKGNILSYLNEYSGVKVEELKKICGIETNPKSLNSIIAKRLIEKYKDKEFIDAFFDHEEIIVKTITTNSGLIPKESMSFPAFDFMDLASEEWENSKTRFLFQKLFLFCVFKENDKTDKGIFFKAFYWRMPSSDLEGEVHET